MRDVLRLADIVRIDAEHDTAAGPGHPASALKLNSTSPGGVAVAGVEGYLFIGDGTNRWERQYLGELTVVDAWKDAWRGLLEGRQVQARAHGVELWNFLAPEKQVVLPEKRWPGAANRGEGRPLRLLQAMLTPDARLIYPEEALRAAQGATYFRHNSHWTATGCCVATQVILDVLAPGVRLADLDLAAERQRTNHDLTAHFFDPPPVEDLLLLAQPGEVTSDNRQLELTGKHVGSRYVLENPHAPDRRRLMLFGDSYAFDAGLAYALSAVFGYVAFVWSKDVVWAEVTQHRADLVLCESAERYIAVLPSA